MKVKQLYTPITMENNENIKLFKLKNKNKISIEITNYGGRIMKINVPDKNGQLTNIVLGYDSLKDTVNGDPYFGAIVGRYANRIAKGQFKLNGKTYQLKTNGFPNHLHGGETGYNAVVWNARQEGNSLLLSHTDPDGHEAYPGNVKVQVIYELNDNNELIINYEALTDKATPVNFTNHAYFNLNGANSQTNILDHSLQINADYYTPTDKTLIPTGSIEPVENTPFDFRKAKQIGRDINENHQQLKFGNGYDHNFVINGKENELKLTAIAVAPLTGIELICYTTEPGVQLYTANFLNVNEFGKKYAPRTAFCLETQHFPDSPNKINFPNTILYPGEVFKSKTIYRFGLKN